LGTVTRFDTLPNTAAARQAAGIWLTGAHVTGVLDLTCATVTVLARPRVRYQLERTSRSRASRAVPAGQSRERPAGGRGPSSRGRPSSESNGG
jgi:hypothetical protein